MFSISSRIRNELGKAQRRVGSSWQLVHGRAVNGVGSRYITLLSLWSSTSLLARQTSWRGLAALPEQPGHSTCTVSLMVPETWETLTNDMKNVVETSKVSLLLLVLSWVLRVCSLIRGHSLNISETTLNHKGCLWSLWIGHNQVFKYSYNLQVITVQMLTACGLRRGYNQPVSLLTTWVSPFLD